MDLTLPRTLVIGLINDTRLIPVALIVDTSRDLASGNSSGLNTRTICSSTLLSMVTAQGDRFDLALALCYSPASTGPDINGYEGSKFDRQACRE